MKKGLVLLSVLLLAGASSSALAAKKGKRTHAKPAAVVETNPNANSFRFIREGFINLMLPGPLVAAMESDAQPAHAKKAKHVRRVKHTKKQAAPKHMKPKGKKKG